MGEKLGLEGHSSHGPGEECGFRTLILQTSQGGQREGS